MKIVTGSRWQSTVCNTEVIIIRMPRSEVSLTCGGEELVPADPRAERQANQGTGGARIGKRYADEESGIEVLCVRPGAEPLAVDGRPVRELAAKPLPSSD